MFILRYDKNYLKNLSLIADLPSYISKNHSFLQKVP